MEVIMIWFDRLLSSEDRYLHFGTSSQWWIISRFSMLPRDKHILTVFLSFRSSGDSTGSTPAQSEAAYSQLIAKHPSTILALNHETEGGWFYFNIVSKTLSYLLVDSRNDCVRTSSPSIYNQIFLNGFFLSHQVLPFAIQQLQKAGYKLVSLAECTGLPAYQSISAPGVRDVSSPLPFFFHVRCWCVPKSTWQC